MNFLLADIAERTGVAVPVGSTLRELVHVMDGNGKGVVVLLDGEIPAGIVTERDVVRILFDGTDMDGETEGYARKPLVVADGKRSIGYALNLMVENNVRRLVLVDPVGRFLGVVTQNDVMKHLEEDYYRSMLKVKHIFYDLKGLVAVSPDDSIAHVLKEMVAHQISAVPVVENDRPVGIVTEKDILKFANKSVHLGDSVRRHMSSPVVCAGMDSNLVDVVKLMNAKNISRVVISSPEGNAVGVITNRDLVRNLEGDYNEYLERKIRETKRFLNLLPEMMLEVIDTGEMQLVVWANDKVSSRFGREIVDRPMEELVPRARWKEIHAMLKRQNKVNGARFDKDGHIFECSGFYVPLERAMEKGRMQLILRDITEEVMLATTDPLTGIYNRRLMNEFLSREAERSLRTKKSFAILLIDLDHFKRVNDTYGHQAGDLVLKEVVKAMVSGIREFDLVGRYGGEEFLVILPEIQEREAADAIAERVRSGIGAHAIALPNGRRISVTASIGVAFFGEDGMSAEELLVKVDERLYQAKRGGRNLVVAC